MSLKTKIIILLIAIVLAAAAVTIVSADTNSILEFFGFGKQTPTPSAEAPVASSSDQQKNDTDEAYFKSFDPALIEPDETDTSAKNSDSWFTDDWKNDPFANSFSESHFDEGPSAGSQSGAQKSMNDNNWNTPPDRYPSGRPNRNPDRVPNMNPDYNPTMNFYRLYDNPVFRPMCELPRTGLTGSEPAEIREKVTYARTNMSLSIPTLNVNEDIVIVPLENDTFPVESLGSNIGLLEGSGPTREDLFVLAAHNHLNAEDKGPFAKLSAMKISDLIFVQGAKNAARTFVVYANELFASDDIEGLLSYARPGCMILITCEDESVDGGYLNRRVIFAEAKEE